MMPQTPKYETKFYTPMSRIPWKTLETLAQKYS